MSNTITTQPAAAGATPPSGYFGALLDVQNAGGKANVITYSNLDGRQNDADNARLLVCMLDVDDRIVEYLRLNGIAKPAVGSSGFRMLTKAWARWVLLDIYTSRGDLDTQNDQEGQVNSSTWDREARRLLRLYVMRCRGGNIASQIHVG